MFRESSALAAVAVLIAAAGCNQSPDQPAGQAAPPTQTAPAAPPPASTAPAAPPSSAAPAPPAQPVPPQVVPVPVPVPVPHPVPYAVPEGYAPLGQLATVTQEANLRAEPNTTSTVLAELPAGSTVDVLCWVTGEPTFGTDKYGSMWLSVSTGGFVHSHLTSPVDVAAC
ncbi:SH3 domain-containing protein [Phytohabitans houttuyneae]|uniref:SH3b domain-containing protein n=1 Tax=Phytohabitans houttuyneae TaxID=1076126 RepID=A0A6V8K150_9ACTN|nr:SH3 domain-containing protein [Phytohabitans houttuyneae]GFJ75899.1 hypothetical protein Phou_000790 [Phytohabitans houttuyneae]